MRSSWLMTKVTVWLLTSIPATLMFGSAVRINPLGWELGSRTLNPRLPILCLQAQERGSRPQILSGIGDEGGEPIVTQARGLRVGRLPQVLSIKSFYSPSLAFPRKLNIQGWAVPTISRRGIGGHSPPYEIYAKVVLNR